MKRDNYILSGSMIVVSLIFFIMTLRLPEKARVYPMFIIGILLFLVLILIVQTHMNKAKQENSKLFKNFQTKQFFIVFITATAYVLLIDVVGYFVTTILYIVASLCGLKISKKHAVCISVGFAAFIYVVFSEVLSVPLPTGLLI